MTSGLWRLGDLPVMRPLSGVPNVDFVDLWSKLLHHGDQVWSGGMGGMSRTTACRAIMVKGREVRAEAEAWASVTGGSWAGRGPQSAVTGGPWAGRGPQSAVTGGSWAGRGLQGTETAMSPTLPVRRRRQDADVAEQGPSRRGCKACLARTERLITYHATMAPSRVLGHVPCGGEGGRQVGL